MLKSLSYDRDFFVFIVLIWLDRVKLIQSIIFSKLEIF